MCAGVVPQQPPTTEAPASTSAATSRANSSGPTVKTVRPSTTLGSPALGLREHAVGTEAAVEADRVGVEAFEERGDAVDVRAG